MWNWINFFPFLKWRTCLLPRFPNILFWYFHLHLLLLWEKYPNHSNHYFLFPRSRNLYTSFKSSWKKLVRHFGRLMLVHSQILMTVAYREFRNASFRWDSKAFWENRWNLKRKIKKNKTPADVTLTLRSLFCACALRERNLAVRLSYGNCVTSIILLDEGRPAISANDLDGFPYIHIWGNYLSHIHRKRNEKKNRTLEDLCRRDDDVGFICLNTLTVAYVRYVLNILDNIA